MNRYIKLMFAVVLICVCFFIGILIGRLAFKNNGSDTDAEITFTENVATAPSASEAPPSPEPSEQTKTVYSIISNDGSIYLYETKDGDRAVVTSASVELSLLPEEDRKRLQTGIDTEDFSEALKIWEGYIS